MKTGKRRAFTLTEVLFSVISICVILAVLIPTLGAVLDVDKVTKSLNNLRVLGTMHVAYANDWDGRQWTVTPDNLTEIVDGYHEYGGGYPSRYRNDVPAVPLGFDCAGEFHETRYGWAVQQFWSQGSCAIGNWRAWNTKPFNNYANGKVYDPLFWAPRNLDLPGNIWDRLRKYIDLDCEYPPNANIFIFPTYCMSVAAQVDPEVFRGESDGGAQEALDLPLGHKTPNLGNARYPDLKTHMLEHYWLNPPPEDPFFPDTEVPWFFNMSDRAEPATLFFDGSVRLLPNMEVLVSNDVVVRQGEDSLWACDAACARCSGYFENYALPPSNLVVYGLVDQVPSHHVFTRDGILGRDTIFNE